MDRRQLLKHLGWLAGGALASVPRNVYAPSMSIEQVQSAMEHLGYLPAGHVTGSSHPLSERALLRFKRHAQRPYRLTHDGRADDQARHACFAGPCDTSVSEDTIFEIKRWVERGWRLPLHRFQFASLAEPGQPTSFALRWSILREDAALVWRELMKEAYGRGATLAEPYGDTYRKLEFQGKTGTSRRSMHKVGRAVDLNQQFGQGAGQRYYLSQEDDAGHTRFRIYCKTAKQDGSQGKFMTARAVQCWRAGARGPIPLPQGWYVDLTDLLAKGGFERISAREGWQKWDILSEWWHYQYAVDMQPSFLDESEWWHYQYAVDMQPSFLDECELIGISEKRLLASGYTLDEIDQTPG